MPRVLKGSGTMDVFFYYEFAFSHREEHNTMKRTCHCTILVDRRMY